MYKTENETKEFLNRYKTLIVRLRDACVRVYSENHKIAATQILEVICFLCWKAMDSKAYREFLLVQGEIYLFDLKNHS